MEVEETNDGLNDELHFEQRLTKVIMNMPENVRDRFKLLKVISDKRTKTIEKIKELNLKFEKNLRLLFMLKDRRSLKVLVILKNM